MRIQSVVGFCFCSFLLPNALTPAAYAQDKPVGVVLAVGDIAECSTEPAKSGRETADLVAKQVEESEKAGLPVAILLLGDLAYDHGRTKDFGCFDKTWGGFKDRLILGSTDRNIVMPVPGNHEYDEKPTGSGSRRTRNAEPYFAYFSKNSWVVQSKNTGYYSARFPAADGPWLFAAINSNIETGRDQPQMRELRDQLLLSADPKCVLAFSHAPYYSSGRHGHGQNDVIDLSARLKPLSAMRSAFDILYHGKATLLVAGHDHHYEQLGRANAEGHADAIQGVRSFVVGTGGTRLHENDYAQKWAFGESIELHRFGILKLTLFESSYEWGFLPVGSDTPMLTGRDSCNRT